MTRKFYSTSDYVSKNPEMKVSAEASQDHSAEWHAFVLEDIQKGPSHYDDAVNAQWARALHSHRARYRMGLVETDYDY